MHTHSSSYSMHYLTARAVLAEVQTSLEEGLSSAVVNERLTIYGSNILKRAAEQIGRIQIFLHQWKSPLIIILLIAGAVSGLLGHTLDMTIILITAGVNGVIGFLQEDKANQALSKLRSLVTYQALVRRDGQKTQIESTALVPGDILYLSAGDKVQADGRILCATEFSVNESALTGESEAVSKTMQKIKKETPLAERKNMVYRGTAVVGGEAVVVVTATGHQTEIGKISTLVRNTKDEQTPLQIQLGRLSRMLSIIIVIVAALILVLGYTLASEKYSIFELFATAVAVAVAAIPEGLVISLTVILAIGMQHILKRKALVRKMVAAETLGSVSVICTDKTGTLTEGNMRVTRIVTNVTDDTVDVGRKISGDSLEALRIGAICNDATHEQRRLGEGQDNFFGDTTETAILSAAADMGMRQHELARTHERHASIPFHSDRKYMATLNTTDAARYVFVKGAPEIILKRSTRYRDGARTRTMTKAQHNQFAAQHEQLAADGLRVLAVAYRPAETQEQLTNHAVHRLIFAGFIGIADPLRSDVVDTIATAKRAGIHIVMITGDHKATALSIAAQIGLPHTEKHLLEGNDLEAMNDAELYEAIKHVYVFARVDPRHKIRIVQAFQQNNEVVAMTGDGVNDAPALKGADIGVALGSGTDVAKEVSDIVLLNDSFSTIVAAIEEGRRIYQNVKKEVLYLLSASMTEVVLIAGSLIAGLPLALLPAQILWMNIVQEGFPTMALAFDSGDKENMQDMPRKRHASLFDHQMKALLVAITLVSNVILFGLFLYFWHTTGDIDRVRTLMFIGVGIGTLFYIYSIRSLRHHVWQMNMWDNRWLNIAVAVSWVLLLAAVYAPPLQTLLQTVSIRAQDWVIMVCFGLVSVAVIEIIKSVDAVKTQYKSS